MDHQTAFLDRILARYPSKQEMVVSVAETLGLSKDAIYRRLRGTTVLSANELITLSDHYQLSTASKTSGADVSFRYNLAEREIRHPGDYLDQLTSYVDVILGLPDLRFYLANPGLPIFHEMMSRKLFAFKLYLYGSTCWNFPGWRTMKYRRAMIDERVLDQARHIAKHTHRVPGRELWTMGMLSATLDQIEFVHMTGRFEDPEAGRELLDELHKIIDHLEAMARAGKKFLPGENPAASDVDFHPAHNELANNDNALLIDSSQQSMLFVTYIMPNYLLSEEEAVCAISRDWFRSIEDHSTSLGANGGKYRDWYFNRLRGQVDEAAKRMGIQN